MTALRDAAAELATANHILFDQGILDAFGHVSARHPDRPGAFLLARNMAPALVTASDVLAFDLEGNAIEASDAKVYLERFIHGEIYRRRPDVRAVVHSHAATVLPFTIAGRRLCPVCHMAGFLQADTPLFEIRDHAGEGSDLLIRNPGLGAHLAECLGGHPLVLMRGHGLTVVGGSLPEAVFRSVYAEMNARVQAASLALAPGAVVFLTAAEAAAADAANRGQMDRAWTFWALRAARTVAALRGDMPEETR